MEYELLDTGVFDDDRYVDVDVEYAKAAPDDIHVRVTITNRSAEPATVHLLPTLWFRNTWWMDQPKGSLRAGDEAVITAEHPDLGVLELRCAGEPVLLFTENETNTERLWGTPNATPYVKDAFHRYVVDGETDAVNPARTGTKAAAHYEVALDGGAEATIELRLCRPDAKRVKPTAVRTVFADRLAEADEFYASITPSTVPADQMAVMRQALAGMLWSKQHYFFDLDRWLDEHDVPPAARRRRTRTAQPQLVPHGQRRRDLDARHVGVPVVRVVGPRLPHRRPEHGRHRLRQGPAAA